MCGLDSPGLVWGPVTGVCELGIEYPDSIKRNLIGGDDLVLSVLNHSK
jgi:hypothetical protein